MATKTLSELQSSEAEAKSKAEGKAILYEDSTVGGIGLAFMGLGMGLEGKGGEFMSIVERKQQNIKDERMKMFEAARRDRVEREAKMERDKERAAVQARHNASIGMQKMNLAMTTAKNTAEMISKGNFKGAENYSMAASKRLGNDYVRYYKREDGKEVMLNFPANVDSKPIIGALQAGDPTYRLNDKNFVERWNPEEEKYENTGWKGNLTDSYMLGGVDDSVGKGVVTVVDKDGNTRIVSRRTAVAEGLTPVKDASNLAKGQVHISSLSPERQKFAKEKYGIGENGVIDVNMLNKDFIKEKRTAVDTAVDAEKDQMKFETTLQTTNTALNKIERSFEVLKEGFGTSGLLGQTTSFIKGSDAGTLDSHYNTLKGIMSFGSLSEMREASKTGGALGNVTEMELKLLGSTTAELDAGLSADVQSRNLEDIREKYTKVLVKASFGNEAAQAGFKKPTPIRRNGVNGWKVMDRFVTDEEMQRSLGGTMYKRMRTLIK